MRIEIFSSGCVRCERLQRNIRSSLLENGITAEVIEVNDPDEMVSRGVRTVPSLIIDGKVMSEGRMLTIKELNGILRGILQAESLQKG